MRKNDDGRNRRSFVLQALPYVAMAIAFLLCFAYIRDFRKESVRRFDETFLRLEAMQDLADLRNRSLLQRIDMTDSRIGRINTVYGALLDEQRKKTIDRVYREEDLAGRMKVGMKLV